MNDVKRNVYFTAVIGNPPYSNFGMMNKSDWIQGLLDDYKKDLNERKLNLDDDFIKFIRFGQYEIEKRGSGILAFITNSTFIDGLTHRRMREYLLEVFDEIHVLNLHGSLTKGEVPPFGQKDENVFDIQQGVSINIFTKLKTSKSVHYLDLWGSREKKYDFLLSNNISSLKWEKLVPQNPYHFFMPKDFGNEDEYLNYFELKKIFTYSGQGIKTERDGVSIHWSESEIRKTVNDFRKLDDAKIREIYELGSDSRDWKVANAKRDVLSNKDENLFQTILYRPFDKRFTWYSGQSRGFIGTPSAPSMYHFVDKQNIGLLAKRQSKREPFSYIWCANQMVESCVFESAYANNTVFPLYLYQDKRQQDLFSSNSAQRSSNISSQFGAIIAEKLGLQFELDKTGDLRKTFGPEDVFHYMYAVFHSPSYRSRYAEFLKIDFPRLPLTSNVELFRQLCGLGQELVALHLLEAPALEKSKVKFTGKGDNTVAKGYPKYQDGVVFVNESQGFAGVTEEVWNFHIGGYQVCHKWLKDRRERELSKEDIVHYGKVVMSLGETIRLMGEVDAVIQVNGGWPMK